MIHIDFGFMLGNSPGGVGVEAAPFKFTAEYLDVLHGVDGPAFKEFRKLFHDGFEAARKHSERLICECMLQVFVWPHLLTTLVCARSDR